MEIIIKVEGMMCNGCENRIKNYLENIKGVKSVEPDYKQGIVKINMKENIELQLIEKAINDLGFKIVKED